MTFKQSKKSVSMLLIFAMAVALLPAGLFSGFSLEIEDEITEGEMEAVEVSEIPGYRGEFEKHYEMSDGTVKAVMYGEAIHYKNEDGWQEVDNTVTLNSFGTKYTAGSGTFMAEFGSANRIYSGSSYLEWSSGKVENGQKHDLSVVPSSGNMTMAAGAGVSGADAPTVSTSVSKVAEVNAYGVLTAGFAERRTIVRNVVSHNKISQSIAVLDTASFEGYEAVYKLNGLIPTLTEYGAIVFSDSEGNMQYTVSPVTAYDLNGTFLPVDVSMNIVGNELVVAYTVNVEGVEDGFTLNSMTTTVQYRGGITDATLLEIYNYAYYDSESISVGYYGALQSSRQRYTGYIKFNSLPFIPFSNNTEYIQSVKLKLTGSSESLITSNKVALFQTFPWKNVGESSNHPLITDQIFYKHDAETDDHVDVVIDENGKCSYDITDFVPYNTEYYYFALDYTENLSTTNSLIHFDSIESSIDSAKPYLEVVYYDVTKSYYMLSNATEFTSNGVTTKKYLDISGSQNNTVVTTDTTEYTRENLWCFKKGTTSVNDFYICTSESVYLNKAYTEVAPSGFDYGLKYLAIDPETEELIISDSNTDNAEWRIIRNSDGTLKIRQTVVVNNQSKVYYLSITNTGELSLSTSTANSSWNYTRCDIISGKVYTIKTMAAEEYVSVYHGYDHSRTDLTMEDTTDRAKYNHQTFRIEYLPDRGAYKIRTMVCMNGWYRPIDIIRSSGNLTDGYRTQIYNDSTQGDSNEACQLFNIEHADERLNVCYIISSSHTNQYLSYHNSDVRVTAYNENNKNNQTWYVEEYTEYYEEYYKSFNIDFPVQDTVAFSFQSSRAWRDWSRITDDPVYDGASSEHAGADFTFTYDDMTYKAPYDSIVSKVGHDEDRGYYVVLKLNGIKVIGTNTEVKVVIQHMRESACVPEGAEISRGTIVGYEGETGVGYPHLHYSVIIDGSNFTNGFSNTIDPLVFYNRDLFVYVPGT